MSPDVSSVRAHSTRTPTVRPGPPSGSVGRLRIRPATAPRLDVLTGLAAAAVTVVGLYFGRGIFVPLALGILLSFALAPVAGRLRRLRIGHIGSVVVTVALAASVLAAIATVLAMQVVDLATNLPAYETNIRTKIQTLREANIGDGLFSRAQTVLTDIGREISQAPAEDPASPTPRGTTADPMPVQIQPPPASPLAILRDVGGPLVQPLGSAGLVFVFVVFILIQREDLRDRLIRLAGADDLRRTTEALDEAAERVSRYLLGQLLYNLAYAVPVGIGLYLIGVPNAALWALLGSVLRFVPYLGAAIATIFPTLLAVAVDPGWSMPLMTVALFVVLETVSGNVIEPWLYGATTGLSSFAVILAAIFWASLWGPLGLLLATPLTVCMVVLGRHVPQLEFMEVLLSNQPVLPPEARLYHRLLARSPEDAAAILEEAIEKQPIAAAYDELVVPALRMAERDRVQGTLDDETVAAIHEGVETMIDEFSETTTPSAPSDRRILCVAGRGQLDEAAASLLADLLLREGMAAEVVACEAVSARRIMTLEATGVSAVVACYLTAGSGRHVGRLSRRLTRRFGSEVPVVICILDGAGEGASDGGMPLPSDVRRTGDLATTAAMVLPARVAPTPETDEPAT
jgi:predicted PurR-regulated permease PerM